MEVKLVISNESFKNDKGENIEYVSCVANIAGMDIKFFPKPEDKNLLKFLLNKTTKVEK